jgi:transketolase N-terminal domain/subunit/beta-xylosidase
MPDYAKLAATVARGFAMDAVHTSNSGHLGLPLGCAEIGAILWGETLSYDPLAPCWLNRDRLVLSAGHGSIFLCAWLHLAGYPLSLEELKRFRQWESMTPGYPEFHHTEGVEATTGPLGQGVGNAVGHAICAQMLASKYNTPDHAIFDHTSWALAVDGCMQEGVASEASAFAGHFKLDNLILIYDANDVTLDAMANKTESEDTAKRYEVYGWETFRIEQGNDLSETDHVLRQAKASRSKNPRFVLARTLIGKGIPEVAGTSKAPGEGGAKFVDEDRIKLGLPAEHFFVSDEVKAFFAERAKELGERHAAWEKKFADWKRKNPELAQALDDATELRVPADLMDRVPTFPPNAKLATRKAGEAALQQVDSAVPSLMGASADNAWIDEFMKFCDENATPVDFISTHHYPTDAFGKPGDDTVSQLAESRRSVLHDEATKARGEARGKPLYYTEWSTSSNPFDELHDQPYAAAFLIKTVMEARTLVEGYSYWTFSDIFEENYFASLPFHGGFGLLTIDGVPKPAYRAYELLHRLGDHILPVEGEHATVDVWVTRKETCLTILMTNGALPCHSIRTERVAVHVRGVKQVESAFLERIDDGHANARRAWLEMGQPERLLPRQVLALEGASTLVPAPVAFRTHDDTAIFEIDVPPQGTALVTVQLS